MPAKRRHGARLARYDRVLAVDTDCRAPDAAMAEDLDQDEKRGVDRHREADALGGMITAVLMPMTRPRNRRAGRRSCRG